MSEAEKKFLHDIASPLMTAIGFVESLKASLGKSKATEPKDLERIAKVETALEKMTALLKARREAIAKE